MQVKIALAGNPNCGKTTLFNILTGSNQYVGNWPGVTVEKKEGTLKGHNDVVIQDLPGIYSLSPYSPEELVTRTYLVEDHPDAILNIVDGTNIERNLYLTTQLMDLGHPVVLAVNMIDLVRRNGDLIDLERLGKALMKAFVFALTKQDVLPETILFYNSGAYLTCEDSDSLADLKDMEAQGVEILTCGTCLDFYGLKEKLAVGSVTNMYVIVEKQEKASRIVKP